VAIFKDGDNRNVVSPEVLDPPHALGLSVTSEGGGVIVHGGGLVAGYTAYMALDAETRIGVVILRNYWRGETHLREAAVGMVGHLSSLKREPSRIFDSPIAIFIGLAGALVVGLLFGRFLRSLNA
jgi:hypothetical protein